MNNSPPSHTCVSEFSPVAENRHAHALYHFFSLFVLEDFFDCTDATDELTGSVPVAKAGMPHPI